jgi:micrococcal nuclease
MPPMRGLFTILLTLGLASAASAGEFTGSVVSVVNGDTIEVLHKKRAERIRLIGIDCPKPRQPFGPMSKHAASALVLGQNVTLHTYGKDKSQHRLANVFLADGTHVNQALVAGGWCWWYHKSAPTDRKLKRLESEARTSKLGLWADPYPIPPWEWQKWRERP